MRKFIAVALGSIVLLLACSCTSSIPESSLTLRNATTNALISTSENTGSIDITVDETYPLMVIRTFRNSEGNTESSDVTQFANFKWIQNNGVCSIDAFGNIVGLTPGIAFLEVKFRETALDPWDIVRLDIIVS